MGEELSEKEEEFLGREFIACISCSRVIPLIPEEVKKEIESEMPGVFMEENDFMASHKEKGHKVVSLWVSDFFSEKAYIEPVKEGWYQVESENRERFIVKKSRTNIEELFSYQLFRGRIKTAVEEITLQEENIRKQLSWEKPDLPNEKLEEIIEVMKGALEIEQESIIDKVNKQFSFLEKNGFLAITDHPLRFSLGLSPEFVNLLKLSIRPICNSQEWPFMSNFIKQNSDVDGILAIQVKIKFRPVILTKGVDYESTRRAVDFLRKAGRFGDN